MFFVSDFLSDTLEEKLVYVFFCKKEFEYYDLMFIFVVIMIPKKEKMNASVCPTKISDIIIPTTLCIRRGEGNYSRKMVHKPHLGENKTTLKGSIPKRKQPVRMDKKPLSVKRRIKPTSSGYTKREQTISRSLS